MMRTILIGILLVVAAGAGWFAFDWYRARHGADPYGDPFVLVDQHGNEITEAAFRGSPSAIFFGFTHCPEVCPTTLFELDGWLAALGDEAAGINAFLVTIDPERDTPEVLGQYVGNVSDRITGISGEPEKVYAMARSFGIYWKKVELEDGDYTMDHTASILLLDRAGDLFGTIAYSENPETAMAKLKRLAAG